MIHLLPPQAGKPGERAITRSSVPVQELRNQFGQQIVTTDFLVTGEIGEPIIAPYGEMLGLKYGEVISIDHHSDHVEMQCQITSTTLAMEYVLSHGTASAVVISHTDCDSVIASAILSGMLSPGAKYWQASLAADHTGAEDTIADLLQSIQDWRDVRLSLSALEMLENDRLDAHASDALHSRRLQRAEMRALVNDGVFEHRGSGVYAGYIPSRIDGELLPALLPEAAVIVMIMPPQREGDGALIKTRLGMYAPEGLSLKDFNLPGWGGRWNAGSTGRHGGTSDPEQFIRLVVERCEAEKHHRMPLG